jgi:hypothetical protein
MTSRIPDVTGPTNAIAAEIDPATTFAATAGPGEWASWGNSADWTGRVSVMHPVATAARP